MPASSRFPLKTSAKACSLSGVTSMSTSSATSRAWATSAGAATRVGLTRDQQACRTCRRLLIGSGSPGSSLVKRFVNRFVNRSDSRLGINVPPRQTGCTCFVRNQSSNRTSRISNFIVPAGTSIETFSPTLRPRSPCASGLATLIRPAS